MVLGSDLRDQSPSRRSGVFNVDMIAERGVHGDAVLEQFDQACCSSYWFRCIRPGARSGRSRGKEATARACTLSGARK